MPSLHTSLQRKQMYVLQTSFFLVRLARENPASSTPSTPFSAVELPARPAVEVLNTAWQQWWDSFLINHWFISLKHSREALRFTIGYCNNYFYKYRLSCTVFYSTWLLFWWKLLSVLRFQFIFWEIFFRNCYQTLRSC